MNILYFFAELPTPMFTWQHIHIFDELERSGVHFDIFNPLKYETVDQANEELIKAADPSKYDMFFTASFPDHLYKSSVEAIKKKGIPTALVSWDNLELPYLHKGNVTAFDVVWVTSQETKYLFEQWGCKKVIFQTYAANPFKFAPNNKELIPSIGFIGSPYGSRTNIINSIIDSGVECNVYSNALFSAGYNTSLGRKQTYSLYKVLRKLNNYLRFDIGRKVLYSTLINKLYKSASLHSDCVNFHAFKSVSDEEMVALYSNFALSLNIAELRDTGILKNPVNKVHLRSFEIPMSGGLQFVRYFDEMAEYFEDGKEIVFYRDEQDMIDKAKYYLDPKHATEIQSMKLAARKRSINEHTWTLRFNKLFTEL